MNISMKDIGYDISEMKIYEDDTMTVEIDTSDWTLEQWATILGGVPIVRCKDCKHYWESAGMCTNASFPINDLIVPNDYCSRAERRTDDD